MAETTTLTIEISAEIEAKLARLEQLSETSRATLAAEALEEFITRELEIVESVLEGIADADAGRVFTQEQVEQETARIIADAEERQARETKRAARA